MAGEKKSSQVQAKKNSSDDVKKKEELEKQIRKRVASEERAFRIVESLVDVTVSIERLKDMAHFILPAHYKDITEERAIAKLCGFPICKGQLGNVKKQKYQISTKTNRVYDITEKKNFCCSKCYKLSKIFEKQILESPLWSRESEKPVEFLLPDTETGWMGVEIIGQNTIFENLNDINKSEDSVNKTKSSSVLDSRNWINELHENLLGEKSLVFNQSENQENDNLEKTEVESLDVAVEDENQGFNLRDVSDFLEEQNSDDAVSDVSERLSVVFDSDDDSDTAVENSLTPRLKKRSNSSQMDRLADGLSEINISNDENREKLKNSSDAKVRFLKRILKVKKKGLSVFIGHVSSDECVNPPPHPPSVDTSKNGKSQSSPALALTTLESVPSASSESKYLESPQHKIQNKLHSWVTQESLKYLGLANEESGDTVEDSKSDFGNSEFAKLCDRLDMRGLEFDELLEEHLPQTVNPPKGSMPSYDDLKKETANFSVKVKEYYKPLPKKKEEKTDDSESVHVLPPVDSVSQTTLRKSIVLQQLGKKMNSLLSPMNMFIGEISTEINELVSTFKLQSDTIVFKPAEWSVIGIFLIFMLSKKLEKLDNALQATEVQERYTKILCPFDLNFQEAQQILYNNILVV